jgi:pre-mRNA-splicing factor CWC22
MAENLGLTNLQEKVSLILETTKGEDANCLDGIFRRDNPENSRFAINFFTSIGLGILTEEMRKYLE